MQKIKTSKGKEGSKSNWGKDSNKKGNGKIPIVDDRTIVSINVSINKLFYFTITLIAFFIGIGWSAKIFIENMINDNTNIKNANKNYIETERHEKIISCLDASGFFNTNCLKNNR